NSSVMIVAPSVTTQYAVEGTGTNGCVDTAYVTVSVNSPPVISVSGNAVSCSGNPVTLTASGGVAYTWQPGGSTGTTVSVSPTVNTLYIVTGLSAAGCQDTASVYVTVKSAPPVIASGITSICTGASTTLTATGAASYNWQP